MGKKDFPWSFKKNDSFVNFWFILVSAFHTKTAKLSRFAAIKFQLLSLTCLAYWRFVFQWNTKFKRKLFCILNSLLELKPYESELPTFFQKKNWRVCCTSVTVIFLSPGSLDVNGAFFFDVFEVFCNSAGKVFLWGYKKIDLQVSFLAFVFESVQNSFFFLQTF